MSSVYFDHNATTALDSRVLDVMLPWLKNQSGNPTSRHVFGRTARTAIEHARAQVAEACGAYPSQVVFTSCGTEANNFAVKGIAANLAPSQILYSAIEHPCVSRPAIAMQYQAYRSKAIAVNQQGQLDIAHFETLLTTPTCLASVMLANN
ncbi:MAG TPA: aminotransferase class V-fold PLP-dependent enzyme, partial [Methylotenera sp.]|nr:aminotransferase class V-fold PLP-dependent enzyme [Methylotenera sp.]